MYSRNMRSIVVGFVYASIIFSTIFDIGAEKNNKKFTFFVLFIQKGNGGIVSSIKNRFRFVA
jgi:hypothetical protein